MVDVNGFLNQLAAFLATNASIEFAGTPRALWVNVADDKNSTTTWSVLRPYGGALPYVPSPTIAVQCMTVSKDGAKSAMARAQLIHSKLLDSNGRPMQRVELTGFRVLGILKLGVPGLLGVDAEQRHQAVFNFDALFIPTA